VIPRTVWAIVPAILSLGVTTDFFQIFRRKMVDPSTSPGGTEWVVPGGPPSGLDRRTRRAPGAACYLIGPSIERQPDDDGRVGEAISSLSLGPDYWRGWSMSTDQTKSLLLTTDRSNAYCALTRGAQTMRGKFVAYYRVSTRRQGASGLGLDAQRTAVLTYLNGGPWDLIREFTEVESGKDDTNRPQLAAALHLCKMTGARLLIAKLDRLSRDVEFLARLQKSSTKFVAADMPEANELVVHIMAAMAQYERQRISERIKVALAEAKRRGTKLGPQPEGIAAIVRHGKRGRALGNAAGRDRAARFAQDLRPTIDELRRDGFTTQTALADELNRRGFQAARGGTWTQAGVGRVLARLGSA